MDKRIGIKGLGSISSLTNRDEGYQSADHMLQSEMIRDAEVPLARLSKEVEQKISDKRASNRKYESLDRSVILSMLASEKAVKQAGWEGKDIGVNIGSSRGATELFEGHYNTFKDEGKASPLASPTTSLGNIASWVANDLNTKSVAFSHSITCSSAMHALLNGIAWLNSGMQDRFLVGGAEAPLTEFTIAQMQALKIYGTNGVAYPCRALDLSKTENTFVLGEGAASMCIELGIDENTLAEIPAWGYSQERITHHTSLSENADCFYHSMKMALKDIDKSEVDAIILHAPGTIKGDKAEYKAVQDLFGDNLPLLTSNKWKIGHTLGASGLLSLEMAVKMIREDRFAPIPYLENDKIGKPIKNVLVNAAGFGGNAVSVLVSTVDR